MPLGRQIESWKQELSVTTAFASKSDFHFIYSRLNQLLIVEGFDRQVEEQYVPCYLPNRGRRDVPAGIYLRILLAVVSNTLGLIKRLTTAALALSSNSRP